MIENRSSANNPVGFLALCGAVAPVIFVVLVIAASTLYKGYNHATQAISELGGVGATVPIVQNVNFFVVGVLITIFAFGLHKGIGGGNGSKVGPVLIGVFGVLGTVSQAFLPCDRGCEFESAVGTLHNVSGLSGFLAAIAGTAIISRRMNADPLWRSYGRFTLIVGLAALVSFVAWIGVSKAAGVVSVNGLLQRVFVGILLLWIEITAVRLFVLSRRGLG